MDMRKAMLSVLAALLAAFAAGAYEVTSSTKIVVPDMDKTGVGAALKAAATALRLDIEESTGLTLPVVEASQAGDAAGAIMIGEKFAADEGIAPPDLRFFDNVIAEKGGRLFLFGHDRPCRTSSAPLLWHKCILASIKAVTDFEYRFMGVRRILPGRTGTEVPKRERISVPDGFRRVSRPIMENGTFGWFSGFDMMYLIANNILGSGSYHTYGGHTYPAACPTDRYFKTHPEYFAMKGGKRINKSKYSALCISNPEVKRLIVERILKEFDEGADVVELGQQDSSDYCECEKCQAYGGPAAKTVGEKYWIFHRSIAEELYRLRPKKTVQLIAYGPTDCRPQTFREFPPNVMVELMSYSEAVFAEWSQYVVPRGFSVYAYMWGEYQLPGITCKVSTPVMARLVRRFVKHNVHSIYRCGYGELMGCEGPATYVFNMLLADPDQDENALFEEYLGAAYGPAAGHMRKFHRAFDERVAAWAECFNSDRMWPWPREKTGANTLNAIYTPAMLDLCESSLAAAENTSGLSEKAKRRLKLVRQEFAYTRLTAEVCMLFDAYRIAPSETLFDAIAARVEKRRSMVDSFFDGQKPLPKPLDGWPEYHPFGARATKDLVLKNGRLFAPLYEPFSWDFAKMRKSLSLIGKTKTAKAVAKGKDAPWQKVGGMTFGKCDYETKFRCFHDDENFYVEVDAELPDSLTFVAKGHDGECYCQECLELFIDPLFEKTRNFHFIWNPVKGSYFEEALGLSSDPLDPEAGKFKVGWDGKWTYSTVRENGRWRSVVTVPFATLGVSRPIPGTRWNLNLGRETFKGGAEPQLQLWNPSMSGRGMSDPESMGIIEFE